jgi:dTDP-4-dehydrorhamnose reductase
MKVIVTGSNGLLGQKLISLLQNEDGVEVYGLARGANRFHGGNFNYHETDLTSKEDVLARFQAIKPDAVIHTAAMTQVDACEQNPYDCMLQNVEVVKNIVLACEQHGTFLTHLSTDFIFDGKNGPYKEEDDANPLSVYGQSKWEAEQWIINNCTSPWAIARTILVYGVVADMSRSNIVLWVKKSLEEGKSIKLINDQWRMPTLAEDLAMGCWLMTKKRAQGVFHISGPDLLNPYQMSLQVAEAFGLDASLITETDGSVFSQPAKRPPKTGFILDKARKELGYQPHSFQAGLALVKKQLQAFS